MWRRLRIQGKLLVLLLGTALVVLGVAGWIGYRAGRQSLERAIFNHLTTVRETKAYQVEAYFRTIRHQVETFSEDRMVVDALRAFRDGFRGLRDGPTAPDPTLEAYYANEYAPRLARTGADASGAAVLLPRTAAGLALQAAYIGRNAHPVGEKDALDAAPAGTPYDVAHGRYHPIFRNFLDRFGYYDLFLVDGESGAIVYSVFKETDFGTSLEDGPYAKANIATAFRAARDDANPHGIHLVDYAPYAPSYGAPAAFISSPVVDGDERLGVLVFQMPVDEVNRVMTGDARWAEDGLGASGETYLVGRDQLMRSISRFLVQEPDRYFGQLAALGVADATRERIRTFETSILFQQVDTDASRAALAGRDGTAVVDDYRGVPVLSSYRPLQIEGLDWAVLSEMDAAEAFAPVAGLRTDLLRWGALLLAAIAALAFLLARRAVRPIRRLSDAARQMAAGELGTRVLVPGGDEVAGLGRSFNRMAQSIEESHAAIEERNRENERLLLNILPRPIARRLRGGEDQIADAFPDVAVLFADIVDFTKLSAKVGADELVALLNDLFTVFDRLMAARGVEKIKTIGDCYMAVCGIPEPVEQPARVLANVALDLLDELQRFNEERGSAFRLRVGLNSGPVVAGVIGSSKFIYDLWGDTVNMASRMESTGEPGTIQVTDEMQAVLSEDFDLEPRGLVDVKGKGMTMVHVLKGRRTPIAG